jgi:hypothetical protein
MAKRSARSTVSDANMSAADPREDGAGGDEVAGDDRRAGSARMVGARRKKKNEKGGETEELVG